MARKSIFALMVIAMLLLAIPLSLTSCGGGDTEVSVFYYTYSDTYMSSVRGYMDSFFKKEGISYHNYDAASNQTTQTEQIDTAISKGTSALIVNVVDTASDDAAKRIVEKAKAANLPLIFFNRSVSEEVVKSYDKCIFVGTDYEMAGHLQGEMIGNYLKDNFTKVDINGDGRISYVMFKGQQGNAEAEARTKYAVEDANKILSSAGLGQLKFYDSSNTNGYLVDQDGNWSNAAANNYMKTVLSGYSEANRNMVELVIANNDEMALGALSALEEAGYNKVGKRFIPVFGIDATEGARNKISTGAMTGTIMQDAKGMAEAIGAVTKNMTTGMGKTDGIDEELLVSESRINIPYSIYTAESTEE